MRSSECLISKDPRNILDLAYLVNARIMQKIHIVAQIWRGGGIRPSMYFDVFVHHHVLFCLLLLLVFPPSLAPDMESALVETHAPDLTICINSCGILRVKIEFPPK